MPNTSPDSIYYPDDNTMVDDLAGLFAAQAASVQAAITDVRNDLAQTPTADSGWTLAGIQPASGWTGVADSNGNASNLKGGIRKVGKIVEVRFRLTRSGGAISADNSGNITDTFMCTITNSAFRPSGTVYSTVDVGPGLGTGGLRIDTNGTCDLVDLYPNSKVNTGRQVQLCAMYFTG